METYIRSPTFHARVEAMMRSYHVPGLSLAIVHKGQTASAGWGHASLDPPRPCTPDTLFDIASCSKSLTAVAVALLVDDDENYPEVQWDAVMSELLPDGDFVMPGDWDAARRKPTTPGPSRGTSATCLSPPLRAKFMYNNLMYTVATHLIEVKTKKPFSDFLADNFFTPLGMHSTHLQPSESRRRGLGDRIGTGYDWDKAEARYHGFQWPDAPEAQGAGLVVSSADDLIRWVKALLHCEGPVSGRVFQGLVRLRTITEPTWRRPRAHTTPSMYAAGLEVHTYRGQRVVSHGGSGFGFAGRFFFLPDPHFGAVMLGNADGADDVQALLTKELIDELLGVPVPERLYLKNFTGKKKAPKTAKAKDLKPRTQAQGQLEEGLSGEGRKAIVINKDAKAYPGSENEKKEESEDPPKPSPPERPTAPLSAYTGVYWHPGYHNFTVQIREGKLFIDAPDRSFGFKITFEHIADNAKFVGRMAFHLSAGGDSPLDAEFGWEDGRVVRMGLDLEPDVRELIWFEKRGGDGVAGVTEGVSEVGVD
ncbi:hypothetical protein PG985_014668 [Apiospora marii]|uniref:uncharacterized protein n=1 Tax=Apiospora marii TaxID=335849 RepID=UPI0031303B62